MRPSARHNLCWPPPNFERMSLFSRGKLFESLVTVQTLKSFLGESNSTTSPFSSITILSELTIVFNLKFVTKLQNFGILPMRDSKDCSIAEE